MFGPKLISFLKEHNDSRSFTITTLAAPNTSSSVTAQEKGAESISQATFGKSHSFSGSDISKYICQS